MQWKANRDTSLDGCQHASEDAASRTESSDACDWRAWAPMQARKPDRFVAWRRLSIGLFTLVLHLIWLKVLPWGSLPSTKPEPAETVVTFWFEESMPATSAATPKPSPLVVKAGSLIPHRLEPVRAEGTLASMLKGDHASPKNPFQSDTEFLPSARKNQANIFALDGSIHALNTKADVFEPMQNQTIKIRMLGEPPPEVALWNDSNPIDYQKTIFDSMWAPDQESLLDEVMRKGTKEFTLKTRWGTKIKCVSGLGTLGMVVCAW